MRAVALLLAFAAAGVLAAQDLRSIAEEAYTFAYPLVIMDLTRQDAAARTPANFFLHLPIFPNDKSHAVVRPNADTLYSTAWLDLAQEPILLQVPDTHGRYYMMQVLDAWTETIAVPGKRTTGTGEGWFAITGPQWSGKLPAGVQRIASPTNMVWLLGRTQTNTAADYAAVHEIQRQFLLMPLSRYPGGVPRPALATAPAAPVAPPPVRVARMSAVEFFRAFAALLEQNPPHAADAPMMAKLARIGIERGKPFRPVDVEALEAGAQAAAKRIGEAAAARGGVGWQQFGQHIGRYGTDYQARAAVARTGLGANPPEDAVYLSNTVDDQGAPLDGSHAYRMHFPKDQLPPVRAFWSLTLYDPDGYFAANPIGRYAIGDRDQLSFNADGSLDLWIQATAPESTSNWLPAPAGRFSLTLRLYWPDDRVLDGTWTAPPVTRN
jgi:hypothetical protein